MKFGWILFVASRYFGSRRREKGHASSILSVLGIAVGVMTLISVMGVMNGFQLGFIESILEISSYHLRIQGTEMNSFTEEDAAVVRQVRGVTAVLPFHEVQTIARGAYSDPQGILLRGVPAEAARLDEGLATHVNIVRGSFDLSLPRSIVLGAELARMLGAQVGDPVSLLSLGGRAAGGNGTAAGLSAQDIPFTVTGIFRSGYYLFDLTWGFLSVEDAGLFLPEAARPVWGVKIENRYADGNISARIRTALAARHDSGAGDIPIVSWRDYNSAFFGALRLEKMMMMFLVGLIFIVVGVNIYHSLRRSVYEKSEEIGVLRALGADPSSVRAVFVSEGLLIGLLGGLSGLLVGLLIAVRINGVFLVLETVVNSFLSVVRFIALPLLGGRVGEQFTIFSPRYFYITEVPSRVLFGEALFIFLFAVLSTTAAAFFASRRVSVIKPVEVLRYE